MAAEMSAPCSPAQRDRGRWCGAPVACAVPGRTPEARSRDTGAARLQQWRERGTESRRARSWAAPGTLPCPFRPGAVAAAQFSFPSTICCSPVLVHSPGPEAPRSPGQRPGVSADPAPAPLPVSHRLPFLLLSLVAARRDLLCLVVLELRRPCSDLMAKEQPQVMFL